MTTHIDSDVFEAALRKLVAANPLHVYQVPGYPQSTACKYLHPGTDSGSCGVGRAMLAAGAPADEVRDFEGKGAPFVLHAFGVNARVANWAGRFQFGQDQGQSWGIALSLADDPQVNVYDI